jgi:hypothetical protein
VAAEAMAAAIGRLNLHPEDVAHIALAMAGAANRTNKHLALVQKVVDELDILATWIQDDLRERTQAGG